MIAVKNLSKDFKSIQALKGINLNVNAGEIYGFIGRNGAGKTTTMNILCGLSRPSSGNCIVNGKDVRLIKHPSELDIGYLAEEPKFFPWMSALETLEYLGNSANRQIKASRIYEILEWVGLKGEAARRVGGFSRGMRQRLGMASALIHDPKLLFLDEPSSALDPEGRNDVLNLILELKRMGKTIFFSSHILDDVERVCDRVGMLVQGRMVLEKPLTVLLNEHIAPIFDIEFNHFDGADVEKISKIEGVLDVVVENNRVAVTANNAEAVSFRLLAYLSLLHVSVCSFALRKKSLEDIFINEVNPNVQL